MSTQLTTQIYGSRDWEAENEQPIQDVLDLLLSSTRIVHGAARGADRLAGRLAKRMGFDVQGYPADWSNGPSGGPLRNQQILDEERIDFAYGFRMRGVAMPGSDDMAQRLTDAKIPHVDIWDDDSWRAEACIQRGAAFLDEEEPDWFSRIDPEKINCSQWSDVISQLYCPAWGIFSVEWFDGHGMGGPLNTRIAEYGFRPPLELREYVYEPKLKPRPTLMLSLAERRLTVGWKLVTLKRRALAAQVNRLERVS